MTRIQCPQCGQACRIQAEWSGKRILCPNCQAKLRVPVLPNRPAESTGATPPATSIASTTRPAPPLTPPALSAASPPSPRPPSTPTAKTNPSRKTKILPDELVAAFDGDIERVKTSWSYRLGILVVASFMLLLPLIYLGLIVALAFSLVIHVMDSGWLFESNSGLRVSSRAFIFVIFAYYSPVFIGGIAILFMIKPLFAKPSQTQRQRILKRESQPLLFAFVDRICEAVSSPEPREIHVDCQVNASASFRQGYWSMLWGDDLVLTIGTPLVAGMTMSQFAGVLAHEFGHFSQGTGMRLTYLIRSIVAWFERVVYARDSWDQWLDDVSAEGDIRVSWIFYLSRLMVWLTRQILWALMCLGHFAAGFLLRQMEYDADRHEARLAGSQTFVATSRRIKQLSVAYQAMQSDMSHFYREGRLADNLPKLLMHRASQLPAEVSRKLLELEQKERTNWFDTHPADRDRIASAMAEEAPGIFHLEMPAAGLMESFDAVCRGSTLDFYRLVLGSQVKPTDLTKTDELIARRAVDRAESQGIDRYFHDTFSMVRGLRLGTAFLQPPQHPRQAVATIQDCIQAITPQIAKHKELLDSFVTANSLIVQGEVATALHRAHVFSRKFEFTVPVATLDESKHSVRQGTRTVEKLSQRLAELEERYARRLLSGLQLALLPEVRRRLDKLPAEQQIHNLQELVEVLERLNRLLTDYVPIHNGLAGLDILLGQLAGNERSEDYVREVLQRASQVHTRLHRIRELAQGIKYPFDHGQGTVSLPAYLLGPQVSSDDIRGILGSGEHFLEAFSAIYTRIVGKLVQVASQVEAIAIRT